MEFNVYWIKIFLLFSICPTFFIFNHVKFLFIHMRIHRATSIFKGMGFGNFFGLIPRLNLDPSPPALNNVLDPYKRIINIVRNGFIYAN